MADSTNVTSTTVDPLAATSSAPTPSGVSDVLTGATPAPAPATPPKRNPLDILEDILDNAEAQKEDNKIQEEKEKQAAELKAKEDVARQQDLQRIEEERAKMANIGETPQEQARQLQQQEKDSQHQAQENEQKGYEIVQLGHTKI